VNFSGVVLTALGSVATALCWNAALAASHRAKLSCFLFWLLLAVALNPDLVRCCPGSKSPRDDMEVSRGEGVPSGALWGPTPRTRPSPPQRSRAPNRAGPEDGRWERDRTRACRSKSSESSLGTYTEDKAESSAAIPSSQQSGPRRWPLGARSDASLPVEEFREPSGDLRRGQGRVLRSDPELPTERAQKTAVGSAIGRKFAGRRVQRGIFQ